MSNANDLPQHVTIPLAQYLRLLRLWAAAEAAIEHMPRTKPATLGELDKDPSAGDLKEHNDLAACLADLGPVKP